MCIPQSNGRRLSEDEVQCVETFTKDLLATSTDHLRTLIKAIDLAKDKIRESSSYRILCKTTQPAHLVTFAVTLALCFVLLPGDRDLASPKASQSGFNPASTRPALLVTFVYLLSASLHFGAQIWMTFVSGLSLFFALPRHHFGRVQEVMFPRYFLINSALSFVTLMCYLRHSRMESWQEKAWIQVATLTLCFAVEFMVRAYMMAPMVRVLRAKTQIEVEAGVGLETGDFYIGDLVNNDAYLALHKRFRSMHMRCAIANMVAMACTVAHLYFLAGKISID